jgi:hypothetical protein
MGLAYGGLDEVGRGRFLFGVLVASDDIAFNQLHPQSGNGLIQSQSNFAGSRCAWPTAGDAKSF